jgi:hypothetical protein
LGMEPKRIELGLELSDEVKVNFERLIETVVGELKRIGVEPEVRDADPTVRSFWSYPE